MNKKGFTLVELLAVITILGVLMAASITAVTKWVGSAKKDSLNALKDTLEMAAKSYALENTQFLPKAIGEERIIKANELKDANFLKENLITSDKKSCMENSFVKINKYDKTEYSYTAYLYCGDEKAEDVEEVEVPSISINMNTPTSSSITYSATEKNRIVGYSYTVSAIYKNNETDPDNPIEVFRSEFFKANKELNVSKEVNLESYVIKNKYTSFIIQAEAYNEKGGYAYKVSSKSANISPSSETVTPIQLRSCDLFTSDSWATIVSNVQSGNYARYPVGCEKEVSLNSLGTHTLKVANNTTPSECSTTGFSQTACGFVLEFANVITTHNMNSTATNSGGWGSSEMRTYVNDTIYNALPSELKNKIIDTTVAYGDPYTDTVTTSTDKLYLLSTYEVNRQVGNDKVTSSHTRVLDYYSGADDVTRKKYLSGGSSEVYWWLRSADSSNHVAFLFVDISGYVSVSRSGSPIGVSPAFRLRG